MTELLVAGKQAAQRAASYARENGKNGDDAQITSQADNVVAGIRELLTRSGGGETIAGIRREMRETLEDGAGIYREEESTRAACEKIA